MFNPVDEYGMMKVNVNGQPSYRQAEITTCTNMIGRLLFRTYKPQLIGNEILYSFVGGEHKIFTRTQ